MVCHVVWWIGINCLVEHIVFVHFVYNSTLFLPSCCCSFLFHVVANLICIFLDSLSTGSAFSSSKISSLLLWSKRLYSAVLLKNFISADVSRFLSFFLRVQISLPHKRMGRASALYTFIVENFQTKVNLKVLFKIPSS